MKTTPPKPVTITRTEAAEIMRRCGTPPASFENCEKCKAHNHCGDYLLKIAEILESPLDTCWIFVDKKLPDDDSDVFAYMKRGE